VAGKREARAMTPPTVEESGQPITYNLQLTTNFRLLLTSACAQILKQGLHLLGIETIEKM
jgi:hypothetical protein